METIHKNVAGERLRELIAEAMEERNKDRHLPATVPPPVWPAWPYLDPGNILGKTVSQEIGPPKRSQQELEWRLKQIPYPYFERTKSGKTFYQHVRTLNLLNILKSPPLLGVIRRVWWFQRYYEGEIDLRRDKKSEYGYPLEFHRKVIFACSSHWHELRTLAEAHAVRKEWFEDYRRAILQEILREAAIYYPQLLEDYSPALQIRPRSFKIHNQLQLYDAIETAFAEKRVTNHKLGQQLTALICSNHKDIARGSLNPTPQNVRDRRKAS